jgi:hypothetical protein
MSDSELFRQYAKEAMVGSLASKDENEKRDVWLKTVGITRRT